MKGAPKYTTEDH